MPLALRVLPALFLAHLATAQQPVTFARLVGEMTDLERLTRMPDPAYQTVQFGSTDRRSTGIEQPGWFANADGFGGEPIPGFEKVLQEPGADGVGEYLVCDVDGPGAIVRGWSAGMDGVLRVWLDGSDVPLFEGKAYDFLARRSERLVAGFGDLEAEVRSWFVQEDADYLPIPFARHLRVCWRGSLRELHFYHLQVRRYAAGTQVETFTAPAVIPLVREWAMMRFPLEVLAGGAEPPTKLAAGATRKWEYKGPGRILEQYVQVPIADAERVLAGVVVRIYFDGSQRPQVEAPLGALFQHWPGCVANESAATSSCVADDMLRLRLRWPMLFASGCVIECINGSDGSCRFAYEAPQDVQPPVIDDQTLYFHAKWRIDRDLFGRAGEEPIDLPYLNAIGQGRFVGVACYLLNPPMDPRWRSNWWGEGDEKIFVDGKIAALGTGSEDYFNYSWSHWRLFSFPYCQQPLASGPGNCGFVSNQRLQILDDLPFTQSLSVALELWTHKPVRPLSYGRITYWYARPGCIDDHRSMQPADVAPLQLEPWPDAVWSKPGEATCARLAALQPKVSAGELTEVPCALTRSQQLLAWHATAGAELTFAVHAPERGRYRLNLLCSWRSDSPKWRANLDGAALLHDKHETVETRADAERLLDVTFDEVELDAGDHQVRLCAPDGGTLRFDTVQLELRRRSAPPLAGAFEAENWPLVASSPGVEIEVQDLGGVASSGAQRWVRAQKAGDFASFRVAAPQPGRYRVVLRLVQSWDFGVLRVDWNGAEAAKDIDLYCGEPHAIKAVEVDLGERDLREPAELNFTLTGSNAKAVAPGSYFGIDCVLLKKP